MCEFTQESWKMYRYILEEECLLFALRGSVASGTFCTWP